MEIITWKSPTGAVIGICPDCQAQLEAEHSWPRDSTGQEYCSVSHGMHSGSCDICQPELAEEE